MKPGGYHAETIAENSRLDIGHPGGASGGDEPGGDRRRDGYKRQRQKHPAIRLLVCTGGPGVVRAVRSSGKKAIGAGAGNPPVIVDDTADIPKAGRDIIDGCTFDNNLPCIAEKEVFAFSDIADELIHYMLEAGSYMITPEQAARLAQIVLVETEDKKTGKKKKTVNRKCVGRDAAVLLDMIGIKAVSYTHLFLRDKEHVK